MDLGGALEEEPAGSVGRLDEAMKDWEGLKMNQADQNAISCGADHQRTGSVWTCCR